MSWFTKALGLAIAAGVAMASHAAGRSDAQPLILAVHPYLPTAEILTRFTPLANALASAIGRPVVVRVGASYDEHIDAIGADSVDIAYMGPASYVTMVGTYGVKPMLARQIADGDPMLHGEIVVRQDSTIQSLQDLKGKRFAFGDPQSTTSHILPAAMLLKDGIAPSALASSKFLGSHKNVALAVLAGDYDAGAVKEEVYEEFAPKGLRSIAHEPPVPDHVLVASRKLPAALVDTLRRTLVQLKETPKGRAAISAIGSGLSAFVEARDSDYDDLRALMRKPLPAGR
jgi:phosphonate transport system substrate-binding protein